VWETKIAYMMGNVTNFYDMMTNILSSPFMLWFYIIGVLCTIFHFANGLWSFCVSWGITISPRSQRISTYVTMVIFILLAIIGIQDILAFV
jgi:succinate dehydrogenase / fumarate reductase cytochrome b subunit